MWRRRTHRRFQMEIQSHQNKDDRQHFRPPDDLMHGLGVNRMDREHRRREKRRRPADSHPPRKQPKQHARRRMQQNVHCIKRPARVVVNCFLKQNRDARHRPP
jgi:hypothetical protein